MAPNKKIDIIVVTLTILVSQGAWYFFALKPLVGVALFTLLSAAYLIARDSTQWRKIVAGSLALGPLIAVVFDLIQSFNAAWTVNSLIPLDIAGVLPVDNIIGYFLMTFLVVVFYEHFFGSGPNLTPPKRFYKVSVFVGLVTIGVLTVFSLSPRALNVPYAYLAGGLLAISIPIYGLYRRPQLLDRCLRMSAYFFFVWFFAEIVALRTAGWTFGGQYIGWVDVFGVKFPFEELFFWMLWYAPFLTMTYEYLMRPKELQTSRIAPG